LHALASLAGAGIRVKADTQGLSGKSNRHANAFPNLIKNLSRNLAGFLGFTLLPIDGPELIGKDHSSESTADGKYNLKRIAFGMAGYGAQQRERRLLVVARRGKDNSGTPACLLVANLW